MKCAVYAIGMSKQYTCITNALCVVATVFNKYDKWVVRFVLSFTPRDTVPNAYEQTGITIYQGYIESFKIGRFPLR